MKRAFKVNYGSKKFIVFIMLCYPAFTLARESYTIVDTAQIRCCSNNAEIGYPKANTNFFGQDAQYTGNEHAYKNNGDGTITDEATDLMWMKVDSGKLRAGKNKDGKLNWQEALSWAENLEFRLDQLGVDCVGDEQLKIAADATNGLCYWKMTPHNKLVARSMGAYCLAEPGVQYLIYAPNGGTVKLDLSEARGEYNVRWLDPRTGDWLDHPNVQSGTTCTLDAPNGKDGFFLSQNDKAKIMSRVIVYLELGVFFSE